MAKKGFYESCGHLKIRLATISWFLSIFYIQNHVAAAVNRVKIDRDTKMRHTLSATNMTNSFRLNAVNKAGLKSFTSMMIKIVFLSRILPVVLIVFLAISSAFAAGTNTIFWDRENERVTADVRDWELVPMLEEVAVQSGWNIFLEPDYTHKASVKFKSLPPGEALRRLLGDMNFAMMPQTNGQQRLYVFRTAMGNATQQMRTARPAPRPKRVPNEIIIRVKPGTDVEALAKSLGAKIVGTIPELNAYRLQFENEEATEAARKKLETNPDVTSVQDNYYVDPPLTPQNVGGIAPPENKLTLDPPKKDGCKVVVVFVDSPLPTLSPELEQLISQRISIAGPATVSDGPTHQVAMINAFSQAVQASGSGNTSVQIVSVDVFGSDASANTFNVAKGMIVGANKGGTVINASLGGYGYSPILCDVIQQLSTRGIPVFAAVGNDASKVPFYPAGCPGVVSVTSVERGKVASYANKGTQPDVGAPGQVLFNYNGFIYGSRGTSVASAAATGMAAGLADSTCAPWSKVIPAVEKGMPVPSAQ